MLRLLSMLCFLSLSLSLSFGVLAAVIEQSFYPQVSIIKNLHSDTIEIKTNQSEFIALYSVFLGSFQPFKIHFTVRSVGELALDYRIKLQESQHYCRNEGEVDVVLSGVVSTTLDGLVFSTIDSGSPGSEGLLVSGSTESSHDLQVLFSSLPQKQITQECYGTFILIAEVTSL